MSDFLNVVLLGIIEGITEFLPISSTGHLLIAEHLGLGARSDVFNVVIQAGAIVAVMLVYQRRLRDLVVNFSKPENRDYLIKLAAAFLITAALGLVVAKLKIKLPEKLQPVAWALFIGGFWMIAAEQWASRRAQNPAIGWPTAILVGLAQIVAGIFPGTSRSAAAIFIAMLAGTTDRAAATDFVFLLGIPTMFAASGYELLKAGKSTCAAAENWGDVGIGTLVSAIVAFIAVKWLLGYIRGHRFTGFAVYRIALGAALLVWLSQHGAPALHGGSTTRCDGSATGSIIPASISLSSRAG